MDEVCVQFICKEQRVAARLTPAALEKCPMLLSMSSLPFSEKESGCEVDMSEFLHHEANLEQVVGHLVEVLNEGKIDPWLYEDGPFFENMKSLHSTMNYLCMELEVLAEAIPALWRWYDNVQVLDFIMEFNSPWAAHALYRQLPWRDHSWFAADPNRWYGDDFLARGARSRFVKQACVQKIIKRMFQKLHGLCPDFHDCLEVMIRYQCSAFMTDDRQLHNLPAQDLLDIANKMVRHNCDAFDTGKWKLQTLPVRELFDLVIQSDDSSVFEFLVERFPLPWKDLFGIQDYTRSASASGAKCKTYAPPNFEQHLTLYFRTLIKIHDSTKHGSDLAQSWIINFLRELIEHSTVFGVIRQRSVLQRDVRLRSVTKFVRQFGYFDPERHLLGCLVYLAEKKAYLRGWDFRDQSRWLYFTLEESDFEYQFFGQKWKLNSVFYDRLLCMHKRAESYFNPIDNDKFPRCNDHEECYILVKCQRPGCVHCRRDPFN